MKRWLKALAIWIGVLAALVLLLTFVPAAKAIPNSVYIGGLLVIITSIAVINQRKRTHR